MTVYHEKCSLHSPVEEKKKEIKSWDEEERDVHARQRNGIVISIWEGRREHGLLHGGGSLIKIFSIHFDSPLFSFSSPVTHFSHIKTHPFPSPFPLSEKSSSQKRKKKKKEKPRGRWRRWTHGAIIIRRGTHKTSLERNVHALLYYSRNFVGGGWLGRSAF